MSSVVNAAYCTVVDKFNLDGWNGCPKDLCRGWLSSYPREALLVATRSTLARRNWYYWTLGAMLEGDFSCSRHVLVSPRLGDESATRNFLWSM